MTLRYNRSMSSPRIITLAFTGAYGMRLLQSLIASGGRVYLLYSSAAQIGARKELDLIDFVVARVLDQLGVAHILGPRWGTHADAPVAIQRA